MAVVQSNAVGFGLNKFTRFDHFRHNRVSVELKSGGERCREKARRVEEGEKKKGSGI